MIAHTFNQTIETARVVDAAMAENLLLAGNAPIAVLFSTDCQLLAMIDPTLC